MHSSDDSPTDSGVYTEHADGRQLYTYNWPRMPEIDEDSCYGDASVILGDINKDAVLHIFSQG